MYALYAVLGISAFTVGALMKTEMSHTYTPPRLAASSFVWDHPACTASRVHAHLCWDVDVTLTVPLFVYKTNKTSRGA